MRKKLAVRIWINQFIKYLVIPLVFCLLLLPLYGLMHFQAEQVLSSEVAEQLTNSVASFENYIRNYQVATIKLFNTEELQYLSLDSAGRPNRALEHIAVDSFSKTTYNLPCSVFSFTTFTNNALVLDGNRIYPDHDSFYSKMLEYDGMTKQEWEKKLEAKERVILPSTLVTINGTSYPEKMLTILQPYITSGGTVRGICHIMMPENELVSLFLPNNEWKQEGLIYLSQSDGTPLLQYHCEQQPNVPLSDFESTLAYNGRNYLFVARQIESLGGRAIIGLPVSLYADTMRSLNITIWTYIGIGFAVCLLLSAFMTLLELRRVNPVLDAIENTDIGSEKLVKDFVAQRVNNYGNLSAELKRAHDALEASRISSMLRTGLISDTDRKTFTQLFGLTKDNYLILIPKNMQEEENGELKIMAAEERIHQIYDTPPYIYNTIEGNTLIIIGLKQADEQSLIRMCHQTEQLYEDLGLTKPLIVSDRFESIDQISSAYWRVRNMLAYADPSQKVCYLNEKSLVQNTTTDINSLERLNEYLMAGRTKEAQSLIDEFFRVDDLSPQNFRQAFYSVRGVLLSAARTAECEDLSFLCADDAGKSVYQRVQDLHDLCFEICSRVDMMKRSHNEELQKNILEWLNEQYMRPELSIAMTAEQFHISQKYVSQFLKDQTGKSYTEYIEDLRLTHAMELLKTTKLGVTEIALKCGFTTQNTFYKAFRRRYGASPSAMRHSAN